MHSIFISYRLGCQKLRSHQAHMDPRGPTQAPRPLHTTSSWIVHVCDTIPLSRVQEVVITRAEAAFHTSRVQLLPNGHTTHVTRTQKMTSFSRSRLKSELTWFPSTTPPLRLTGYDRYQPTPTTSTSDTIDSSVGRRANAAVVRSWAFKSDMTHPRMKVEVVNYSTMVCTAWLGGSVWYVILLQQSSQWNLFGGDANMEAWWSGFQSDWYKQAGWRKNKHLKDELCFFIFK